MLRLLWRLKKDETAAVAATVALSLFGLIAVGGIAFDYARMATLDTELQNAADQAALAGATQLDGFADSRTRATTAARSLVLNITRISNDGLGRSVSIPTIEFLTNTNAPASSDANATRIRVSVRKRSVNYALTPISGLLSSGELGAVALAGVEASVCNVPPVYIALDSAELNNIRDGYGLRLLNRDGPGQFGYLQNGKGINDLKKLLAWDYQEGSCQATDKVTNQTGRADSVEKGFNTRFNISQGAGDCPKGGICSRAAIPEPYPPDTCHDGTTVPPCTSTIGDGKWGKTGTRYADYVKEHDLKLKVYDYNQDRRRLTVAVVPFGAFGSGGSAQPVRPIRWLDVFVVRAMRIEGKVDSLYVEVIGDSRSASSGLRNVPYLIE